MASDLDQLIEMGFDKERAQLAVAKGTGRTIFPLALCCRRLLTCFIFFTTLVQGALEWLEKNQDKSIDEIKEDEEAEGPALTPGEEARSLVCNECGKKFRSHAQAEFHASKSQHTDFSESTEELAPLTDEQRQARLQELRERLAAKRAVQSEQDKVDQKRNEVRELLSLPDPVIQANQVLSQEIRRKANKDSQDVKEELDRKQRLKEAEQKKKDKMADIEAKQRVKARIEADKQERRLRAEREKAERAGVAPPAQPAPVPAATTSGPVASKPASAYTETRLRFQTPKGNIMKTVPVTTTLFEVAAALKQEDGVEVQSFVQNFPRKVFNAEFFGESLKDLGLIPSASLVIQ